MSKLKLFFVGGFLGSGKTTAIAGAAAYLQRNNVDVSVITNDQGVQQVDTKFIRGRNISSEEISGGCFCCNYHELDQSIESLRLSEQPDIIFAESVGSCTDLAATVVNPLLSYNQEQYEIVLSVFADIRLVLRFLMNERPAFHDTVSYIYQLQLKEADIIVVNKADLLDGEQVEQVRQLMELEYPDKIILFQNSLSEESVKRWLDTCDNFKNRSMRSTPEVDYNIYGAGEAQLAWLDEEIGIVTSQKDAVKTAYSFMHTVYNSITAKGYPVGHLKFLLDDGVGQKKISFTSFSEAVDNDPEYPETNKVILLINARIQAEPVLLRALVREVITEIENSTGCKMMEYTLSSFQPGYPRPTHRITA